MSTRAGDFDPEVLYFLLAKELLSLEELRELLNHQSGLAGISGILRWRYPGYSASGS